MERSDSQTSITSQTSSTPSIHGGAFMVHHTDIFTNTPALEDAMTLRKCSQYYRDARGSAYAGHKVPELDGATDKRSIMTMTKFNNNVGHMMVIDDVKSMYCCKPEVLPNLVTLAARVTETFETDMTTGYHWCHSKLGLWKLVDDRWRQGIRMLLPEVEALLARLPTPSVLSMYTFHAHAETSRRGTAANTLKQFPPILQSSINASVYGTLHINQLVDMATGDQYNENEVDLRRPLPEHMGFLCGGYTPHTLEAGRKRRVVHGVTVRVLTRYLLTRLNVVLTRASHTKGDWVVHCIGLMVMCDFVTVKRLATIMLGMLASSPYSPTFHMDTANKSMTISISSGVLMRKCYEGADVDNVMMHNAKGWDVDATITTEMSLMGLFSTYFSLVPYITYDRPPRTLLSAGQAAQAVSSPYSILGCIISPVNSSKPLVTTPLMDQVLVNPDIATTPAGHDVMVCLANFNSNYEDCIMVSRSAAERGLFSNMVCSTHIIDSAEEVPDDGDDVTFDGSKWWKVYSDRETRQKHRPVNTTRVGTTITLPSNARKVTPYASGNGRVLLSMPTDMGDVRVDVMRMSTLVTGDKIATQHGQKGVVMLVNDEDMPYAMDGEMSIKFDMVMAVSSVSNRVTAGQYYEMVSGLDACKYSRVTVIGPASKPLDNPECVLYDGTTGEVITRMEDGNEVDCLASYGACRVWQLSQMTWDKQHYTHSTAGMGSTKVSSGRTRGGGIRIGEMESYALASGGLTHTLEEMISRTDIVNMPICITCNRNAFLCTCVESNLVDAMLPMSTVCFDVVTALVYGESLKYQLS